MRDLSHEIDAEVTALAKRIAELGEGERTRVFHMSWWSERMLQWAMSHPSFKTQLFRFVDVFPATTGDADVARHLQEYFEGAEVPPALDFGLDIATHVPGGRAISATVARRNILRMANQFIVGSTPEGTVSGLHRLWRSGSAFTVDLLGEKTVTEREADDYAARVGRMIDVLSEACAHWAPDDHLERDDAGPLPRVNVSVKPTALAPSLSPLTAGEGLEQAKSRLRPILARAKARGSFVHFDMEHHDVKDLTLRLFRELLDEDPDLEAGIAIQAYLKDSWRDLGDLVDYSASRRVPLTVRLVKGAYWDSETVLARQNGWPAPVFESKPQADANYERCVRLLHDNHGRVRAAFATHNLRSLAYAIQYARSKRVHEYGYEIQMLYGMAEPIQAAVRRLGSRLRVYAPVGDLLPGMAYLVRRLLENTSNESFVRRRFAEQRSVDELVAPSAVGELPEPPAAVRRPPTQPTAPGPYEPEPAAEWRRRDVREAFGAAVRRAPGRWPIAVPAIVDGLQIRTADQIPSVDPGDTRTTVAVSASCGPAEADAALEAVTRAAAKWRRTPALQRAAVLFRAAEWMRERRHDLAALEVFEAGKPWTQADADVAEAIDFCEYYGRQALRLDAGGDVQSPDGEANRLAYAPRGVGVVIAPWNFPLAIPAGMVSAALVMGNGVIFKPAEQTPATGLRLVEALRAGGLPDGVLAFLPGYGERVGAYLVEHPAVSFVAFTGSKAVGLGIVEAAGVHRPGQRQVKRVVAEMGGKNAIVVDADADLDQAVPAIVQSAFGYAGQKCSAASRVIALDAVHDALVDRLVGATRLARVGHPRDEGAVVGPLIDAEAHARVARYASLAEKEGRVVYAGSEVPEGGWYAAPTIAVDVPPGAAVFTDEIFGPVLTVTRAPSFEEAIDLANRTDYALTAGAFSRLPHHLDYAARELRAGNVYLNRGITGAIVGRQPFGGHGLSGVGSKAGGPDYLLQFCDPRAISENTMRQGFAPSDT